jgi:hypothetical protein
VAWRPRASRYGPGAELRCGGTSDAYLAPGRLYFLGVPPLDAAAEPYCGEVGVLPPGAPQTAPSGTGAAVGPAGACGAQPGAVVASLVRSLAECVRW